MPDTDPLALLDEKVRSFLNRKPREWKCVIDGGGFGAGYGSLIEPHEMAYIRSTLIRQAKELAERDQRIECLKGRDDALVTFNAEWQSKARAYEAAIDRCLLDTSMGADIAAILRNIHGVIKGLVGAAPLTSAERQLSALRQAQALETWHEDVGPVLWWRFPLDEPPYCGTPLDTDWPGYHTHWTPLPTARAAEIEKATEGDGNG